MPKLQIKNFEVGYQDLTVLENINLTVENNKTVSIIGHNGCGKSTLIKSIIGLIPKRKGQLYIDDIEIDNIPIHNMIKRGISYFPQNGLIIPSLTVKEHLDLISNKNNEDVFNYFPKLKKLKSKIGGNLSGGERQILSFGVMMKQNSKLWFLDEPTAGLSPKMVDYTIKLIKELRKELNITLLIVEHNMEVVYSLSDMVKEIKNKKLDFN